MLDILDKDKFFMKKALDLAQKAFFQNEVPIAAVLVKRDKIIKAAHNKKREHAEFSILKNCKIYDECDIYVTLEPCCVCAAMIARARIKRLFFGAYDKKGGCVEHNAFVFNSVIHNTQIIGGVLERETGALLKQFFQRKRDQK
jgi:tRNA(adenine34) deaminase